MMLRYDKHHLNPDNTNTQIHKTHNTEFGTHRYIANLGHGMLPSHDPAKLKVFIDAVHEFSEALIKKA